MSHTLPKALKPGDTICVIAPGSPVEDEDAYRTGRRRLERMGYRVVEAPNLRGRRLFFAGDDLERARDVSAAFRDPSVKALFCARGGAGALRILPYLDYPEISEHPKMLLGYSDITALQVALFTKCGLVSFYGPMVTTEIGRGFSRYTSENLFSQLTRPEEILVGNPPGHAAETLVPGEASGELLGGCLSVFVSLLGTPYEPDTTGKILFFEDIDETPHRIDRFLTQLLLAGKLQAAAGILFGVFRNADYAAGHPYAAMGVGVVDVLRDRVAGLGVPVICGLQFGHAQDTLTLPIGAHARLDTCGQALYIGPSVR